MRGPGRAARLPPTMRPPRLTRTALLGLAGLALVAAPAAEAEKRKPRLSATYMTTVKANMTERWDYRENYVSHEPDGTNTREEKGSGTASANLRTRRPFPLMVIRGPKGRPPTLNHGSDGIPMSGGWLRSGEITITYDGPWGAANPDRTFETTGCGMIDDKPFASIGWSYDTPGSLQLFGISEPHRDDCPDGPLSGGYRWEGGESPMLTDVLAAAGKHKFLRTKQFTVRGATTWNGAMDPVSRSSKDGSFQRGGSSTVTWQWEATFRMKKEKRKRKRR